MDVGLEKEKFRKAILEKLKRHSLELRRQKSDAIIQKLKQDSVYRTSRAVMFYVPLAAEVNTTRLLEEALSKGQTVVVPFVSQANQALMAVQIGDPDRDLIPGTYGIKEPRKELVKPFEVSQLDLIFVPGLAFDQKGHRLGRGKGYYDRFLKTVPKRVMRYGLAFDFQVFDSIPVNATDISVDRVITN